MPNAIFYCCFNKSNLGCNCNVEGSESLQCDKNGQCKCKTGFIGLTCSECNVGFEGDQCDKCAPEFHGYPDCKGMNV